MAVSSPFCSPSNVLTLTSHASRLSLPCSELWAVGLNRANKSYSYVKGQRKEPGGAPKGQGQNNMSNKINNENIKL